MDRRTIEMLIAIAFMAGVVVGFGAGVLAP